MLHLIDAPLDNDVLQDIELPPQSEFGWGPGKLMRGSPSMITAMTVNCPMQADARYGINLPRLPYVQSEAARQGDITHRAAENNFKFDTPIPTPIKRRLIGFSKRVATYKAHPLFDVAGVEEGLYINADGPCQKGQHALGAASDLIIRNPEQGVILYCDWKDQTTHTGSGNAKPAKVDAVQAELTAAIAFMSDPELKSFIAFYEFLQHNQTVKAFFTRNKSTYTVQLPDGRRYESDYTIASQVQQLWWRQRNNKFEAKQSGLCKAYCDVLSCQFNGKR